MTYIWLNRAGKTTPQALMIRSAFVIFFTTLSVTLTHLPTAGASAQNICPSQDPDKFIDLYSESLLLQKTFITFPLKYTFYDDDEDKGMLKKTTMIKKIPGYTVAGRQRWAHIY